MPWAIPPIEYNQIFPNLLSYCFNTIIVRTLVPASAMATTMVIAYITSWTMETAYDMVDARGVLGGCV